MDNLLRFILVECNDAPTAIREAAYVRYKTACATCPIEALEQILDELRANRKLAAIKAVRTLTGCGLREAKDLIDRMRETKDLVDGILAR